MNTTAKLIIAAIVIVAAVLGFQVYKDKMGAIAPSVDDQALPSDQSEGEQETSTTTAPSVPVAAPSVEMKRVTDAGAGKVVDAAKVLAIPGAGATEAQRKAHDDLILSSAVDTNTIVLTSCKPQPTVPRIRLGADVYLVNDDSVERVASFGEGLVFPVPAGSSTVAKMDFKKGPGIYGFGCGESSGPVGMIVVAE